MFLRRSFPLTHGLGTALVLLAGLSVPGAEPSKKSAPSPAPPPVREPERRELWVPSEALEEVLRQNPDAVLLTPQEYEALVRDAGRVSHEASTPEDAALSSVNVEAIRLRGEVRSGAADVRFTGTLSLNVVGEGWQRTKLPLLMEMTHIHSEGNVLLRTDVSGMSLPTTSNQKYRALEIYAKGPGRREVRFETILPVSTRIDTGEKWLNLSWFGCDGVWDIEFPDGTSVQTELPFEITGPVHRFLAQHRPLGSFVRDLKGLPKITAKKLSPLAVTWLDPATDGRRSSMLWNPRGQAAVEIDESNILNRLKIHGFLQSAASESETLRIPIVPANRSIEVERVSGLSVEQWRQVGDTLEITVKRRGLALAAESHEGHSGHPTQTPVRRRGVAIPIEVDLREPIGIDAGDGQVFESTLPSLDLGGEVVLETTVTVGEDLDLLDLTGGSSRVNLADRPVSTSFAAASTTPLLRTRRTLPRIEADVDALIRLEKDSVLLTRTLALRTDRPFRSIKLVLPDGEELNEVTSQQGAALDWKRVDRTIEVRFADAVKADAPAVLQVSSRKKLARAWSGAGIPEDVSVASLGLPDAVKVAGYAALDFDESWNVALGAARGLEDRDARLTPVKGRMAWFGLRDWELPFTVERSASVYSAELTAYALPRSRTIEIEGQVRLEISGAPLRSFRMQLPPEIAPSLRWTSREIGEQQVDEETGIWTCTLVQEITGRPVLRFRLSLPAIEKPPGRAQGDWPDAPVGSARLAADLPKFAMPEARRFQGTWVIEANTDTELSLTAKSMQPLDVLRVPAVQDYQPRHRIVAAYRFGAGENALSLNARRHVHAEMAALVILKQTMRSVLGTDGAAFHETRIDLRHSGEQFVALRLPNGALLLSTTVDGAAVKPVRGPDGSVAIPLPGGSANAASTLIVVQYRLAGSPWSGRGKLALAPPHPLGDIPVLETRWEIHAPEGWRYSTGKTTLYQESADEPVALLSALRHCLVPGYLAEVKEVQELLWRGHSAFELGNNDDAIRDYEEVLRLDPHNAAARRGMEHVESKKREHFDSARDHQRARMLNEVNQAWEDRNEPEAKPSLGAAISEGRYLTEKMSQIIFPTVQLQGASIEEAIEFLRVKSRDLDQFEPNPTKKGVNLILKTGAIPVNATISIDLRDVPMTEALRYITELAGMKFKVEPYAVVIAPISDVSAEQYTRIYKVPPDFLSMGAEANQAPAAASDPFASASASPTTGLIQRQTAKDIFQAQGIPFPEGSSAIYNPATSELIVRNTQSNLDLVETFSQSLSVHAGPSGPPPIIPDQFRLSELKGPDPETELLREKLNSVILPTVNFRGATLEEAIEFIRIKGRDTYDGSAGISIRLGEGLSPSSPNISMDLRDVSVAEAIRYITELAGVKYVIRNGEVVVVPLSDVAASIEERAYALPSEAMANTFPVNQSPKNALMNQGIPFPEGTSAEMQPDGKTLVVRNTTPYLELIEAFLAAIWNQSKDTPPYSLDQLRRDQEQAASERLMASGDELLPQLGFSDPFASKEGLIPLEVELPQAGRTLVFSGHQNPETIELRFASWERLLAEACGWMLAGAGLFVWFGRRGHPWRSTFLALALLAGAIPNWLPSWTLTANALLFGWLTALVASQIWLLARRCARCCSTDSETLQPGGDHATV